MATSSTSKLSLPLDYYPANSLSQGTLDQARIMVSWFGKESSELNKPTATALRLDMYPGITLCVVDEINQQSVIHKAAQTADSVALQVFLEKNCLHDVPDANGDTPLGLLIQRYVETENAPQLGEVVANLIERGARLDHPNKDGITPMRRILAAKSDLLFHQCLELPGAPLAHAFIHLSDVADEPDAILQGRLQLALTKPGFRKNLLVMLLGFDFSSEPKNLCRMLRTLVHDVRYSPVWLDALRSDNNQQSVFCKLDALAKEKVDEPMRKHFYGLGYDKKPAEHQALLAWFERSQLPLPNSPSPIRDASDKPQRTSSWGHPPRSADTHALRRRGDSATELMQGMSLAHIQKQIEDSAAQKILATKRFKSNILSYIVSADAEEIRIVQEILKKNPKFINQSYKGTFLLTRAIKARCNEMTHFLLEHDASANVYDNDYNTPLHHALLSEIEQPNGQTPLILRLLIKKGGNFNALNRASQSPLDLLFKASRPELFEPFLSEQIDWTPLVAKEIERGGPRSESGKRCILLLLNQKKISPKFLLATLLKVNFEENDKFRQQLLSETLTQCEKMEAVEVASLASDFRDESLREKVRVFKTVPKFYVDILHTLFQQTNFSAVLMQSMLEEMDTDIYPDYDLIYSDKDKEKRREKIQILLNLSIISTQRKAEFLAARKGIGCSEAFALGLAQLLPDFNSINWCSQLKELAKDKQTLTPIQISLLRKVFAWDLIPLKEIVGMLFEQDVRRSDPLKPGPYEIMLDIAVSHCKLIYPEWIDILLSDKDTISYQRKIEICERYTQFGALLKNQIKQKVGMLRSSSPGKLERTHSSGLVRSTSRSQKASRSQPGSGSTTPRGSAWEKKSQK